MASKFKQKEGKLSAYTIGKGAQELYWLIEGKYAISPRTLYFGGYGEEIARCVELFKARPDTRYTCGYNFMFSHTASSLDGLREVCWHLMADFKGLLEVGEALEGYEFEGKEPIDLSYAAPIGWNKPADDEEGETEQ